MSRNKAPSKRLIVLQLFVIEPLLSFSPCKSGNNLSLTFPAVSVCVLNRAFHQNQEPSAYEFSIMQKEYGNPVISRCEGYRLCHRFLSRVSRTSRLAYKTIYAFLIIPHLSEVKHALVNTRSTD